MNNLSCINKSLGLCKLFSHFSERDIESLFINNYAFTKIYTKNDIIFTEGELCNHLSIIIGGIVEIQQFDYDGNIFIVSTLQPLNVFGENLLFGDKNNYPISVVCKKDALVLHIYKDYIYSLCKNDHIFLIKLLNILSNKAIALNYKLKQVTMKTLRQMICNFLLIKYLKSKSFIIPLNMTKKEWAEKLGVQRPSLSRELINMKKEGLIDYDKKAIKILALDDIKGYI